MLRYHCSMHQVTATAHFPRPGSPDWRTEIEDNGLHAEFVFDRYEDGSLELRELCVDGEHATAAVLRRLADQLPFYLETARGMLSERPAAIAAMEELRRAGQGRNGLPREFLEAVAAEYSQLPASGRVSALARAHKVNRSTVTRWVRRARELGLLEA
jgi:hypothetical protein